jgi:hypothetical protein
MARSWNASDGRLWAAEFSSGDELFRCMTGAWLLEQPGIDHVVAAPAANAIRGFRPRLIGGDLGDGPLTVVIRPRTVKANAVTFEAEISVCDDTLATTLAEQHPSYANQPSSSAPLGGTKFGAANEWSSDANASTRTSPLELASYALIAAVLVGIVALFALYGREIVAIWGALLRLLIAGIVIWLVIKAVRWAR